MSCNPSGIGFILLRLLGYARFSLHTSKDMKYCHASEEYGAACHLDSRKTEMPFHLSLLDHSKKAKGGHICISTQTILLKIVT